MNTTSAAQRDLLLLEEMPAAVSPRYLDEACARLVAAPEGEASSAGLKDEVAARLAAHRARRGQPSSAPAVTAIAKAAPAKARSARIAATVAERYANSPSYRAFLAAEAENAIRQAEAARLEAEAAAREADAAAEVAAISAKAVADAQYELLAELDQWSSSPSSSTPPLHIAAAATLLPGAAHPPFPNSAARQGAAQGLTVRIYDDPTRMAAPPPSSRRTQSYEPMDEAEAFVLDEEIAFRQAPVFDEFGEAMEIPANLIEFPRQLVAARRARPRLAEGPLRDGAGQPPDPAQLRIFEVESAQISVAAASLEALQAAEPEWSSILLAAHPISSSAAEASLFHPVFATHFEAQPAPLSRRILASFVDACILGIVFLASAAAFAETFTRISTRFYADRPIAALSAPLAIQNAAIGTLVTLAILALLYQLLFFSFSDATPGMRYARIALCTFSDDNPTRRIMRRRILAVLLAACPLGIGIFWAWLDEEGLGWHDRISRTYQRSY